MVVKSIAKIIAIDAIPTDSPAAKRLKASHAVGVGHVGATYPVRGKLKGTGMVLGSIKKLKKGSKKIGL